MPLVIMCVDRTGPYLHSTIIWPFIALLHVSLGLIAVARTGIYLCSTIVWYIFPVPLVTSWHVLGHIFVSCSYLSTRVPLTP